VEQAVRQVAECVRRGVGSMLHGRLQSCIEVHPIESINRGGLVTSPSIASKSDYSTS
jgi:hypothetical protein